jgi:Pyruvate/2-oxoacid:ferredoxin oxidoreductase gamma subunit
MCLPPSNRCIVEIRDLSKKVLFLKATENSELGNPIVANIIMIGAVTGGGILSITGKELEKAVIENVSQDRGDINLKAFTMAKK